MRPPRPTAWWSWPRAGWWPNGAPKEVFQDVEGLKSVGLTVPDTTELLWELRREGLDVPLDALSDEECAQALKDLLAQRRN